MNSSRWPPRIAVAAILSMYAATLLFWRDRVPNGLFSDTAQEALRGLYLVEGKHFEVITFSFGNSAETLYLYIVGGMLSLLGPSTIAIQLTSWLFALACVFLIWKLTACISETIPAWVPLLTATSSLWLFHYARSGLRAIAAPVFLAAFTLLLDRSERHPDARADAVCGVVLGLSIYSYTACRVLPIAFVVYGVIRLLSRPQNRKLLTGSYRTIVGWAFAVSVPNLLFLIKQPAGFLTRGNYVLVGNNWDKVSNVISTALTPFYYADRYRDVIGRGFFFDAISAALTARGHNPLHFILSAALVIGLLQAKQFFEKPVFAFLLSAWITSVLILGVAGPSLTRLLILLPVYLVFAALGFGALLAKIPSARAGLLVMMIWVWLSSDYKYMFGAGEPEAASVYFNAAATPMGREAERLAHEGRRVLCVLSREKDVVAFLTHDESSRVKIVEFYRQELDPSQVPFLTFQPDDLLIENLSRFNGFTGQFPQALRVGHNDAFYDIRFPPAASGH
jgi:Dolichyl-phosphate-mannose-protein mannosyltransferase